MTFLKRHCRPHEMTHIVPDPSEPLHALALSTLEVEGSLSWLLVPSEKASKRLLALPVQISVSLR